MDLVEKPLPLVEGQVWLGEALALVPDLLQRAVDQRGERADSGTVLEVARGDNSQGAKVTPCLAEVLDQRGEFGIQAAREAGVHHDQHVFAAAAKGGADHLARGQRRSRQAFHVCAGETQVVAPGVTLLAVPCDVDNERIVIVSSGQVVLMQECAHVLH